MNEQVKAILDRAEAFSCGDEFALYPGDEVELNRLMGGGDTPAGVFRIGNRLYWPTKWAPAKQEGPAA